MAASARRPFPSLDEAVAIAEGTLPQAGLGRDRPILVLLSGLPGTGKSHLARLLTAQRPFLIVESDRIRKTLFSQPDYSSGESALVHRTCQALIDRKLADGIPVIYDATNLVEYFREKVYQVARDRGAALVVVRTVAQETVIRERLENRHPDDRSDADWEVYQLLMNQEEPISVPHLVVHTDRGAEAAVARVLEALE